MYDYDELRYESEPDIDNYQGWEGYEDALALHEFRCDESFCYESSNYIVNDKNDNDLEDEYYYPIFDFYSDVDDYLTYLMDSYFRTTIFGGYLDVTDFGFIPKLGYITQSAYKREKLDEFYIVEDAYWLHKVCGYDIASYGYNDDLNLNPYD